METTSSARRPRRGRYRALLVALLALAAVAAAAGSAQAATLSVSRQTDPANDPTSVTYHVDFTPFTSADKPYGVPSDFQLVGGQTMTFPDVQKGYYTITEQTPSGWTLVDISCAPTDPDPADAYLIDVAHAKVRVELSGSESKGCTFTDRQNPVTPPPAGPPPPPATPVAQVAPSQLPAVVVSPARVARGSARLVAPQRCVVNTFTVAVSGSRVRTITWVINGHKHKTTRGRPGQRRFSVRLSPAGVQRIEARVTFAANTSPRTKTLRKTVRRCVPSAVRPQFTG